MKKAQRNSECIHASSKNSILSRSLALFHSMIVQVMGIKIRPQFDYFALTIEAHKIRVLVDDLLACGAPFD